MPTHDIVQKLWNLCNVLRDDGITYHQYVNELTYFLFLKMAKETDAETNIPEGYRWDRLRELTGTALSTFYRKLLLHLGTKAKGRIQLIYANANTSITQPKNLEKIISNIDKLDWYSAREEGLGELYEGLLEKNAGEKKSGAGQYFTPRPLINVMVRLIDPRPGELCHDPAAGTFGFMIAADRYLKQETDDYFDLSPADAEFQQREAFSGIELVPDAHRLALMNALLHGIEGPLVLGDALSNDGKAFAQLDVVLTNPPFGTKKGGEQPTRDDLTFKSSNKQLNFLQVIYRSLKTDGKARAAVVLPDNVLFQDGEGLNVRRDLMNKCDLHTILRLPTGIFYAQGVKTNVLFFTRGVTDTGNTRRIAFYDLRTNLPSFGKTNPLTESHFKEFEETFGAPDADKLKLERWTLLTREEVAARGDTLDLGLIRDQSLAAHDDLPAPHILAADAVTELNACIDELNEILDVMDAGEEES